MSTINDFDELLTAWLADEAPTQEPDGLASVALARTRRTRQVASAGPLERWLHMELTLRRPMLAMPLRLLAIVLALLLLLIAAMSVPFLFGTRSLPATVVGEEVRNGLVAFGRDGDIWVVDPAGGEPRVLVGGPDADDTPDWSPDGTRIAFWRAVGSTYDLVVAGADGQRATVITPAPMADDAEFWWSPDGSSFVISSTVDGTPSVSILGSDGAGFATLDLGAPADSATWHPDGRSLLVRLRSADGTGLYPVSVPDGAVGDPIAMSDTTSPFYAADRGTTDLIWPAFSADGSMITYAQGQLPLDGQSGMFGGWDLRNWVMAADGTGAQMIEYAVDSDYENAPSWAPTGTKLSMAVKAGGSNRLAIADAAGGEPMVVTDPEENAGGDYHVWAPDGTAILVVRGVDWVTSLVDTATGARTMRPWLGGPPDWQPLPVAS